MTGNINYFSEGGVGSDDVREIKRGSLSRPDRKSLFAKIDEELLERLDRKLAIKQLKPYPKMFSSQTEIKYPPLICAASTVALGDLTGWFRASGVPVNICNNTNDLEYHVEATDLLPSLIVLEVEGIGGFEKVLDPLLALRVNYPEIPVILISSEFTSNDFSSSRLYIADICLRHPLSLFQIEDALDVAFSNNKKWRKRNTDNY